MPKLPALLFYTGDWKKDPSVAMCSPATRGIWIDFLCAMHDNGHGGQVIGTTDQLSRIARCTVAEIVSAIKELTETKTADVSERDGTFTLVCRRMKRESFEKNGNAQRQAKFREKGGGDPDRWTAIRATILVRDGHMCAYCGGRATTVDHVTPRSKGGPHTPENLVGCCKSCNSKKCDRTLKESNMCFWKGFDCSKLQISNTKVTLIEDEYVPVFEIRKERGPGEENQMYHPDSRVALWWLNERAGVHFRELRESLDPISARLSEEGVTIDGVKQMIERQVKLWKGTPQQEYLRPSTLFGQGKFDGYYANRKKPIVDPSAPKKLNYLANNGNP